MSSPAAPTDGQAASAPKPKAGRDDRLKAALKANLARRKAQAKARDVKDAPGDSERE